MLPLIMRRDVLVPQQDDYGRKAEAKAASTSGGQSSPDSIVGEAFRAQFSTCSLSAQPGCKQFSSFHRLPLHVFEGSTP